MDSMEGYLNQARNRETALIPNHRMAEYLAAVEKWEVEA